MMEGRCYHRTAGLSSRSVKPPASKRDITAVTLPPPWQGQRHQHQSLWQWNTLAQLGAYDHILPVLSFWRCLIMGLLYFPIPYLLGFSLIYWSLALKNWQRRINVDMKKKEIIKKGVKEKGN